MQKKREKMKSSEVSSFIKEAEVLFKKNNFFYLPEDFLRLLNMKNLTDYLQEFTI